mgnify:CR=1 FL=1
MRGEKPTTPLTPRRQQREEDELFRMSYQDILIDQTFQFIVPGDPRGKERARAIKTKGGGIRLFTPDRTRNYESTVSFYASEALGGITVSGAVHVEIVAILKRPKKYAFVYKKTNKPKTTSQKR